MNTALALYLSGAPYLVRVHHKKGGKRVAVLDRTKRWRAAAQAMKAAGVHPIAIACALGKSRQTIDRVTNFTWRF